MGLQCRPARAVLCFAEPLPKLGRCYAGRRRNHRRGEERRTFLWARRGGSSRLSSPTTGRACPRKSSRGASPRTSRQNPRGSGTRPRAPPGPALRRRTRRLGLYRERAGCRHAAAPLPIARASSWASQQHRRARRSHTRRHLTAAYSTSSTQRRLRRRRSRRKLRETV